MVPQECALFVEVDSKGSRAMSCTPRNKDCGENLRVKKPWSPKFTARSLFKLRCNC